MQIWSNLRDLNKSLNVQSLSKRQKNNVWNIIYHDNALLLLWFNKKKKFEIVIKFDQSSALAKKIEKHEEYWQNN